MESLTTLLFKVSEHVAYITLNRPTAVNSVSLELAEELHAVARECDDSNSVRAVLLTGAGRIFCGGGDLKSFAAQEPSHLPAHIKRVNLFFHSAIQCFARMRAPVVVAGEEARRRGVGGVWGGPARDISHPRARALLTP